MAASEQKAGSTEQPAKPIDLFRGWPSPHLLAADILEEAAGRVLSDALVSVPSLQYGPDPGYQPLREALAAWLGKAYGAEEDANRICVTGGASQGLACILQSYTDPAYTRAVWLVAPCYHLACPIFEDSGFHGRLRAVPEDEWGMDVVCLESGLRASDREDGPDGPMYKCPGLVRKAYRHIIYLVPTCANPSGKTMPLLRRQDLVRLARKHDALVISDDVYDFLQWPVLSSPPQAQATIPLPVLLPRLSDLDLALGRSAHDRPGGAHFGHAISNGSFSKLVGPGVRTGWVDATPAFANGLARTGSSRSGGAPSQLVASMLHAALVAGRLDTHLRERVRPALQRRHALVRDAVVRVLGPKGVVVEGGGGQEGGVAGGYFVWLKLPDGMDAREVVERAEREGRLVVVPGSLFEVLGDEQAARFPRNIRLSFSWQDEVDLVQGVERLGKVVGRMLYEGKRSA